MMYFPDNIDTNCGVYRIKNMRNGKFYIGSTKNASNRKSKHFSTLRRGIHDCTHLQNAWNLETDKSVFEFQMFIYCDKDDRIAMEQSCIDVMQPEYNLSLIAGKVEMTDEVKQKIRVKRKEFLSNNPNHLVDYARSDSGREDYKNRGSKISKTQKANPSDPIVKTEIKLQII